MFQSPQPIYCVIFILTKQGIICLWPVTTQSYRGMIIQWHATYNMQLKEYVCRAPHKIWKWKYTDKDNVTSFSWACIKYITWTLSKGANSNFAALFSQFIITQLSLKTHKKQQRSACYDLPFSFRSLRKHFCHQVDWDSSSTRWELEPGFVVEFNIPLLREDGTSSCIHLLLLAYLVKVFLAENMTTHV